MAQKQIPRVGPIPFSPKGRALGSFAGNGLLEEGITHGLRHYSNGKKRPETSYVPRYRRWKGISDKELLRMSDVAIKELKRIARARKEKVNVGRGDLSRYDPALSNEIKKRGLWEQVNLSRHIEGFGKYNSLSKSQLIALGKAVAQEKGYTRPDHFTKGGDTGLIATLWRKGLVAMLGLPDYTSRTEWKLLSDDELVSYTKTYIIENGIRNLNELSLDEIGSRIYKQLNNRGLTKFFKKLKGST